MIEQLRERQLGPMLRPSQEQAQETEHEQECLHSTINCVPTHHPEQRCYVEVSAVIEKDSCSASITTGLTWRRQSETASSAEQEEHSKLPHGDCLEKHAFGLELSLAGNGVGCHCQPLTEIATSAQSLMPSNQHDSL